MDDIPDRFGDIDDPLVLPEALAEEPRAHFPLVAAVAPIIVSLVIWAVTRSPFVLVFAALGPVVAVASVLDRRLQRRRAERRSRSERTAALARLSEEVALRHERERRLLRAEHPPLMPLHEGEPVPTVWNSPHPTPEVALGAGIAPSALRIEGRPLDDAERRLCAAARTVTRAPVVVDVTGGVGIVGPRLTARAFARALVCRVTQRLPPDRLQVSTLPQHGWEWALTLPHAVPDHDVPVDAVPGRTGSRSGDPERIDLGVAEVFGDTPAFLSSGPSIVMAATATRLPPVATVIVFEEASGWRIHTSPVQSVLGTSIEPELLSEAEAQLLARDLAGRARVLGWESERRLPTTLALEAVPQPAADPSNLNCAIGITASGPLEIDLVRDGPHAVVGGTTGSGKSELLIAWVCAMAAGRSPRDVTFLLVDFKGGATFAPLTGLPHCVGVVTDLDEAGASRAIESLRAELRHREHVLAEAGVSDIRRLESANALPRLVIVVDEFASMTSVFPAFHELFADLAARGRSLGVHLILCTQRPLGVVRDAVLANCPLRLSLRVTSASDSTAVIGSDAAARLPSTLPGRCVVVKAGEEQLAQLALASPTDTAAIVAHTGGQTVPRRPWLDPLPAQIPLDSLTSGTACVAPEGIVLGVDDVPEEQRQSPVGYRPGHDGHLLALGSSAAGKTGLLNLMAAQWPHHLVVPPHPESAWDLLADTSLRAGGGEQLLVLVDDLDVLCSRLDEAHRTILIERFGAMLREGAARSVTVAATAARLPAELRGLVPLFAERMLLRMPDRQEHVLAGGDAQLWLPRTPPGSATWRGRRVQLAVTEGAIEQPPTEPPVLRFHVGATYVLVTRRPEGRARALGRTLSDAARIERVGVRAAAPIAPAGSRAPDHADALELIDSDASRVFVGDPDAWQAHWSLLSRLREASTLLFDDCTPAELRALARTAEPAPAVAGQGRVLALTPEGGWRRLRWNPQWDLN